MVFASNLVRSKQVRSSLVLFVPEKMSGVVIRLYPSVSILNSFLNVLFVIILRRVREKAIITRPCINYCEPHSSPWRRKEKPWIQKQESY
jgi:hypothetical protein